MNFHSTKIMFSHNLIDNISTNKVTLLTENSPDLKESQQQIERMQKYVATAAEALLQPFVILNPLYDDDNNIYDFVYKYANEASAVSNRIPVRDMLGKTLLELFPHHRFNGVFDKFREVQLTGKPWRETLHYDGPAGKTTLKGSYEMSAAKVESGLAVTWNDITHLKLTEERLRRSENKFNLAFNNSPAAMVLSKAGGEIVDINKAYENIFGFSRNELIGKKSVDTGIFTDPRDRDLLIKILQKDGAIKNLEFELRNKKKEIVYTILSISQLEIENEPHLLSVIVDMTDRRKLELSLQDMLREKVALLQEVHHRVRNNMQIILSMLNLQRNSITDNLLNDQLLAAQNRIRSMALVYDKLFPSDTYSTLYLKQYLSALVSESADSLFTPEVQLEFNNIDDLSIDIEAAIKIGLIINELFTNSFKHAFTEASQGKISLIVSKINAHKLNLSYSDNGSGLPANLDVKHPSSLGLKLINILVEDLNGSIEYKRTDNHTAFQIVLNI